MGARSLAPVVHAPVILSPGQLTRLPEVHPPKLAPFRGWPSVVGLFGWQSDSIISQMSIQLCSSSCLRASIVLGPLD